MELHEHHVQPSIVGGPWSRGNKAFCDFVHRGKVGKYQPLTVWERALYVMENPLDTMARPVETFDA
jgi:hypothetical protein